MLMDMPMNQPPLAAPSTPAFVVHITVGTDGGIDISATRQIDPVTMLQVVSHALTGLIDGMKAQAAQQAPKLVIARPMG